MKNSHIIKTGLILLALIFGIQLLTDISSIFSSLAESKIDHIRESIQSGHYGANIIDKYRNNIENGLSIEDAGIFRDTSKELLEIFPKKIQHPSDNSEPHITTDVETKLIPPKDGVYHGAFARFGPTEDVVTTEQIQGFKELVEKDIVWGYFSNNWFDGIHYPEQQIEELHSNDVIPFVRLMPRSSFQGANQDPVYTLDKIIDGQFDQDIRSWARSARDSNIPMLIEFGTEVNGNWFSWSGALNGGGETQGYGDPDLPDGPERFKDAYRHIIDIFDDEGAHDITWFFHVNLPSDPEEDWNYPEQYYPGDEYIDWIGISVYGAQDRNDKLIPFTELMDEHFHTVAEISPNKPIAILEFGVVEREGENKSEWIDEALQSIINKRYENIYAISYWHSQWTDKDGSVYDMRINSSEASLSTYKNLIKDPIFITDPIFSQ